MSVIVASSAELEASTKMEVEELKFRWKIDNMFAIGNVRAEGLPIKSPVFSGGNTVKYSWQLEFDSDTYNKRLKLHLLSVGKTALRDGEIQACGFASYQSELHALADKGRNRNQYEKLKTGKTLNMSIELDNFHEKAKGFISNNVLTFHCIIFVYLGLEQSCVTRSVINGPESVVKSLQTVLNSGDFSDVQLITPTKKISAHKVILAARSPVFAAMFRCSMQEAKLNSVEINDFDEEIVDAMIEFMYSGRTKLSTNLFYCPDLLRIADKYELLDLKLETEKYLASHVTIQNAVDHLVLACLHHCDALKRNAIIFIDRNKDELSGTEAFKELGTGRHPEILKDLFLSVNKKKIVETDLFKFLAKDHPQMLMELYLAN